MWSTNYCPSELSVSSILSRYARYDGPSSPLISSPVILLCWYHSQESKVSPTTSMVEEPWAREIYNFQTSEIGTGNKKTKKRRQNYQRSI